MSGAIRKLHEYLAKSPSVVYPEDVLARLSAIEVENANMRKTATMLASARTDLLAENAKLRDLVLGMMICSDDSEEAQKCPLYDENEPYRCGKDRLMGELGLSKE